MTKVSDDDVGVKKSIPDGVATLETLGDASLAREEAALIGVSGDDAKSYEDLEEAHRQAGLKRDEKFREHFDRITIVALYLMAIGVALFAVCWGVHVVLPEKWHWLNEAQIERIQNIVTGGLLFGLVSDQFKRRTRSSP